MPRPIPNLWWATTCRDLPIHFGQALLALAQGQLPALVAGGFNWVDVRDVVEAALRAEERAPAGAQYLLSGHWVSLRDVAALVQEITTVPAPRFVCPLPLAPVGAPLATLWARLRGTRPLFTTASLLALRSNRHISHARAAGDLGYGPRPFRQTIEDTLRWFAEAGCLPCPRLLPSSEAQ